MVWKAILGYPFVNFRRLYSIHPKGELTWHASGPCEWMSSRNITGSKTTAAEDSGSHTVKTSMSICTNTKKTQQIIQVVSQINLWSTFKLEPINCEHPRRAFVCQHPLKSTHGNPNIFFPREDTEIRCVDTVASISSLSECCRSTYFTSMENSQSMKNSRHHNWNISLKYCGQLLSQDFF